MKEKYIKCTLKEDAPLFESFLYIKGENGSFRRLLDLPDSLDIKEESNVDALENVIHILQSKGFCSFKAETLSEKTFIEDIDSIRTDGLPYLLFDIDSPTDRFRLIS